VSFNRATIVLAFGGGSIRICKFIGQVMKPICTRVVLVVALVMNSAAAWAQLLLRTGESFTHEFSTLPFLYYFTAHGPPFSLFRFAAIPGSFQPGTELQYEMFADSLSESAAFSGILTEMPGNEYRAVPPDFYIWADLQGAIRLTTLTGSVMIAEIELGNANFRDLMRHNWYATKFVPPPRLVSRRMETGTLRLTWTTNAASYRLESSTEGPVPGPWAPVPEPVVIRGSDYAVDLATSGGRRWFRLSKLSPAALN